MGGGGHYQNLALPWAVTLGGHLILLVTAPLWALQTTILSFYSAF
jgi:hypothetical protein